MNKILLLAAVPLMFSTQLFAKEELSIDHYKGNIEKAYEKMAVGAEAGPFKPNWDSLNSHNATPDWFLDGKIGIYFHWGVYSVPAYGNEWYPNFMHAKPGTSRRSYYDHHVKTYGEPEDFGYHDLVPLFKAEKFDAEEWAELFKASGARWAGPAAEHHDGFSMWASDLTPWNAENKGPKKDLTGLLSKAIKKQGIKFVTSFHNERGLKWYPRIEGYATTSSDPILQFLYMNIDPELYYKMFQTKLGEVIDKYEPDLIWFDSKMDLIPDEYHQRFLAYYFNKAKELNKEVVVTTKKRQYPEEVAVFDYEKGHSEHLTLFPWLVDDTVGSGSWSYTETLKIKSADDVIDDFIDAVSKNGQLLLNISPKADGTIPENQKQVLLEIGKWLKINGEAIYSTRPWFEFGEGPNRLDEEGIFVKSAKYVSKDVRYTRSKDNKTLFATLLDWPDTASFSLDILQVNGSDNGKVELLGHKGELKYTVENKKITVQLPNAKPGKYAYSFKLTGFETSLTPAAAANRKATIESFKTNPPDKHPRGDKDKKEAGRKKYETKKKKNKNKNKNKKEINI